MTRFLGAVVAVLAVATACSPAAAPPTETPTPTHDRTEEPRTAPRFAGRTCGPGTLSVPVASSASSARPVAGERLVPARHGGRPALVQAVASTGEVLLEVGRDERPDGSKGMRTGRLYVLDPATGRRILVRGESDLRSGVQTPFAAMDGDHVVWLEHPGTSMSVMNWTMYAYDRKAKRTSTVARAPELAEVGGAPAVPGWTVPQLRDGRVYWPEARTNPVAGKPPVVNVYGRELGAAAPSKPIVADAVQPVVTGDWLYYARFDSERHDEPGYAIYRKSLSDGRTQLVHADAKRGGGDFLTAYGDTSAWVEGDSVLVFRGSTRVARVRVPEGHQPAWLSAGANAIGFTTGEGTAETDLLLDLRGGCRLHRLADAEGLAAVRLAGRTVAWAVADPEASDGPGPSKAWYVGRLR